MPNKDDIAIAAAVAAQASQQAKAAKAGHLKPVTVATTSWTSPSTIIGALLILGFVGSFVAMLMRTKI